MPTHLLALSGGADSVYLLLQMLEQGEKITAVHVNHGLRGAESDEDEAFVRALCQEKGVPLLVYRAHPPENPGEGWAREARYAFFRQAARETGIHTIALAHHMDDQAETLLLHLLRGAGLSGLTAMAEDSTVDGLRILRPLLGVRHADIVAELRRRGQPWREDSSNQDTKYLRNALRQDIMPRLESLAPGAARRIACTACLLREDEAALEREALRVAGEWDKPWLPLERLRGRQNAVLSRVLRQWVRRCAPHSQEQSMSFQETRAVMALLEAPAGEQVTLSGDRLVYRGWSHLHIVGGAMYPLTCTPCILPFTGWPGDGKRTQVIPRALWEQATLRTRRQGDFIRPFGSAGRQSLQDYFVNRRIDAPFRDSVPLLCIGSEVLMAFGVGASERLRLDDTQDHIIIHIEGELPWMEQDNNGGI